MSGITLRRALVLTLGQMLACADPPPAFEAPRILGGKTVSAQALNEGQRIYTSFCASCHGGDGSGRGPAARGLSHPPRDFRTASFKVAGGDRLPTDAELLEVVRNGRTDAGMPAFPHLPPDDRDAVVQFIKTFSPRWAQEPPVAP